MQSTQEQWKPVVGYESRYEASDLGRIRSLDALDRLGRALTGRFLKFDRHAGGHLHVNLSLDGCRRKYSVHRLVIIAFVGESPGLQVRHLNGNPADNRLVNLKWGTHSENQRDAVMHGTHSMTRRTHCPQGHEYSADNTYTRPNGSRMCRSCSRARDAARRAHSLAA